MTNEPFIDQAYAPIYLLPGMTPNFPIYARLQPLLPNATIVDFIPPRPRESLISYAHRLALDIPPRSFVVGVSFGGILALEISRIVRPLGCILISTIKHPAELPPWFRMGRFLGVGTCSPALRSIGRLATLMPKRLRTASTLRATKLAGTAGQWHRWATTAVIDWSRCRQKPGPRIESCPVLQIHGTKDTTFPIRFIQPDIRVHSGTHSIALTHPQELADSILSFMKANM